MCGSTEILLSLFLYIMRSKANRFALKEQHTYPLKDKSAIVIMASDNPLWDYECYDYAGVFIGYMGPSEKNPVYNRGTCPPYPL